MARSIDSSLRRALAAWDGKAVDPIQAVYAHHRQQRSFVDDLLTALGDPNLQTASTWILKKSLDDGDPLRPAESDRLLAALPYLEPWAARLHALQVLAYLTIPDERVEMVETFLRAGLDDDNKFVRAWSYGGLHHLASQHPRFRDEVDLLLDRASETEAASVRARIRRIRKTR